MGLFDRNRKIEGISYFGKEKTPPGQRATEKFPVLTYGDTPAITTAEWRFRVFGEVEKEVVWTWKEFLRFPQTTIRVEGREVGERSGIPVG